MTTVTKGKLTSTQINDAVQYLLKLVAIGNGEPSLKEIIRYQGLDIKEIRKESTERFIHLETQIKKTTETFEKSLEDSKQKELEHWKERYESLVKRHQSEETAERKNKTYWTRVVIGLFLAQVIQAVFTYFFMSK